MIRPPESASVPLAMDVWNRSPLKLLGDISTVVGIKTRVSVKNWTLAFHWGTGLSAAAVLYAERLCWRRLCGVHQGYSRDVGVHTSR